MLWILFVILIILWGLGLVIGYSMGGAHSCPADHRPDPGADAGYSKTETIADI